MLIDLVHYPSPEAIDATAIYVIGDIHGCYGLARQMEATILRDIVAQDYKKPVICCLGDYIDRGPQSSNVLAWLADKPFDGLPCVFLKGNHEDWMLSFLQAPDEVGINWLFNGGADTVESYGIDIDDDPEDAGYLWLRARLMQAVPHEHLHFLEDLRLAFVWDRYICVHAGIDPRRNLSEQRARDLLWIREPFLKSSKDFGFRIVHGHTIVETPEFRKNRIGIDTGAFDSNILSCVALTRTDVRLLTVGESSAESIGYP